MTTTTDKEFEKNFEKAYQEKMPNFEQSINIAIVGKVSSGKSSLLNAILDCQREAPTAAVGANSGVTTKVTAYKLDKNVLIIDCPGLDDVREENSNETVKFLSSIDLGIFVVTGSADITQQKNFEDLKKSSRNVLVILNKIDEWDDLESSELDNVKKQWQETLGVRTIYGACTKGYDPKMKKTAAMDLRGIKEIQDDIFKFLNSEGKAILLARHLKSKENFAIGIIGTALIAVAGEAFIPGSAAYITATQVIAITSLNYLYKGEVLSKSSALGLLPTFGGQSLGTTAFLWAKSFLPPTLVLDVAAAGIAVTITFAMLGTVKWMFENEHSLEEKELLKTAFNNFSKIGEELKNMSPADFKNKDKLLALLGRLLSKAA
ncbi:GTPase [Curvibacter gracilis]|uniref:GTPase n=1 Tax=Curvibacter gracilis TaxID=230310 RepID=UPI000A018819|nr:GTPase [Curvibacter gracilis]